MRGIKSTGFFMLALLAGCAAGPDFQRPEAPRADHYTAQPSALEAPAGGESAQQAVLGERLDRAWWRLFESDALDGVVKRALAHNRTLAAAGFTLAQARELAAARAGARYPQVAMTAGAGREKYGAEFLGSSPKPPSFTYFAVGPTVAYSLDYAGATARAVEEQYARANFQRRQLDAAYLAVTGNAVLESLEIASLRAQIATVEVLLEQDRENRRLAQEAFDAGAVSRLDVIAADSRLAADAALLPPLGQELSLAQDALAVVLGQAPAEAAPELDLAQLALPRRLPVSLPSELAHRRPDILAAEEELHAATAAVGAATANLYPPRKRSLHRTRGRARQSRRAPCAGRGRRCHHGQSGGGLAQSC